SNHPPGLHGNGKPGNWLEGGNHGNQGQQHHLHGNHGNHHEEKHHGGPRGGFGVLFPLRTDYMFARVRGPVRTPLGAVSACLWLRPGGTPSPGGAPPNPGTPRLGTPNSGTPPNLGTPFSYAAPGQPNELVLLAWGGRPLELLVDDQAVALSLSPALGRWQHLCVTWAGLG
ncbi:NPTX1 protein, partial [Chloropsis hardwickii]|nr:NPTX1 protein [Chloropsis hardwickii]